MQPCLQERITALAHLCEMLVESLESGASPSAAQVEALHRHLDAIHPHTSTDRLDDVWHTLRAAEIWLSLAAEQGGDRGRAVDTAIHHLRLALQQLNGLIAVRGADD